MDDHFVCSPRAMIGLCDRACKRCPPTCSADRVMGILRRFDFVGFVEHEERAVDWIQAQLGCGARDGAPHLEERRIAVGSLATLREKLRLHAQVLGTSS